MSLPDSATPPLTIDVRGRRAERWLGVLALLGVASAAMLLPLPPGPALLFAVVVAALVGLGSWRQGWLGGADRVTTISWLSDGRWLLVGATGKNIPAILAADSRVGSRWLWLRWHTPAGRRSMLLVPGDVLPAEFRRLGVRLRLESVFVEPIQTRFIGARP
jgi:hypothetical protein